MAVRITQAYLAVLRPLTGTVSLDVSNSLGFAQTLMGTEYLTDSIGFAETADHNYIYISASNLFSFESATGFDQELFIVEYLGFTPRHFADAGNSLFSSDVFKERGSFLSFIEPAITATNQFGFDETLTQIFVTSDALGFSQSIIGVNAQSLLDDLGFSQVIDTSATNYERDLSQGFIKQTLGFTITGPGCIEKTYRPFIGEGDNTGFASMPTTAPVIEPDTVTFTFPVDAPTTTLVLKNPDFGDIDGFEYTSVSRRSRGGDRIIFADAKWSKFDTREFTIKHLKADKTDQLIAFINDTLGQEVGIRDWEGEDWRGIIVAPQTEISETKSGFTITIRFQGAKV